MVGGGGWVWIGLAGVMVGVLGAGGGWKGEVQVWVPVGGHEGAALQL